MMFAYKVDAQFFTLFTELGLKGSVGATYLQNENIQNDNKVTEIPNSLYYTYGGKVSLSYIGAMPDYTIFGIHGEYLYGQFSKEYTAIRYSSADEYSKMINYKINTINILFRYTNARYRFYLEAGPQFTSFVTVTETNSISSPLFYTNDSNFNLSTSYVPFKSIVLGIGFHYKFISAGFRVCNSMESIMNTGMHPISDGFYNDLVTNPHYNEYYFKDAATSLLSLEFTLDLNIPFFSIGKASCGNRSYSFFRPVNEQYYWGRGW